MPSATAMPDVPPPCSAASAPPPSISGSKKAAPTPETPYGAFHRAVETAEAESQAKMIESIRTQAQGLETTYTRTHIRKVIQPVPNGTGLLLDENREPVMRVTALGESTVTITRTKFNTRLALEWLRRMPTNDDTDSAAQTEP